MSAMLLPSIYSNVLQLQRCIAKMIAHEKLESEQLTTIRVAISNLQWHEEGKELIFNNQLFDVESFEIVNDTMVIRGLTDIRETAIKDAVNKLVHHTGSDQVLKNIGYQILHFTAFQPNYSSFHALVVLFKEQYTDHYCNKHLPIIYTPVQTPPPDHSSC